MVKILISGDINGLDDWTLLSQRVNAVIASHGSFDILFLSGKLFKDEVEYMAIHDKIDLPILTYGYDRTGVPVNARPNPRSPNDDDNSSSSSSSRQYYPHNLHFISDHSTDINRICTVVTISKLTIGYMNNSSTLIGDKQSQINDIKRMITDSKSYRGCDILFTNEWPHDLHQFITNAEFQAYKEAGLNISIGSSIVSDFAMLLKPRYHISSGKDVYFLRSPYRNIPGCPITRFIGLSSVSSSKEKNKKWLHALSLEPITHLNTSDIIDEPIGTTDNPYAKVGQSLSADSQPSKRSKTDQYNTNATATGGVGYHMNPITTNTGGMFFGNKGFTREGQSIHSQQQHAVCTIPYTTSSKTLFVGGIRETMTDGEIRKTFPSAVNLKRPEGKAFCFLEFTTHEAAKYIVDCSTNRPITICQRNVSVGWAKETDKTAQVTNKGGSSISYSSQQMHNKLSADAVTQAAASGNPDITQQPPVVLEAPQSDAKLLFVSYSYHAEAHAEVRQLFPSAVDFTFIPKKSYVFIEFATHADAKAIVDAHNNDTASIIQNGSKLIIGWSSIQAVGGNKSKREAAMQQPPSADIATLFIGNINPLVTNEDLEKLFTNRSNSKTLSVYRPLGREYAFIEFESHADALSIVNDVHNCTIDMKLYNNELMSIGWAKGKPADRLAKHNSNSTHQSDCWFCLASPTIKVHLLVSVGDQSYVAIPKGGLADMHVLLAPIDCVPNRLLLSNECKQEMKKYEVAISAMFQSLNYSMIIFERAIRTKGRDHLQQHLVPVSDSMVDAALSIFLDMTIKMTAPALKFIEIENDSQDVDEVVLTMEGGPYQEYFYIQIPIPPSTSGGRQYKRFVYVQEHTTNRFPMFIGTEICAYILGCPNRANWKNCVVSDSEEMQLAESFRTLFAPYDISAVEADE